MIPPKDDRGEERPGERRSFSVAVYARCEDRLLIIRHKRLGVWLPVGGECEPNETPLEAARRELREESGLVGVFPIVSDIDGTPAGLIGYEEHPAGRKGRHLNFVFVADVPDQAVTPNDEFEEWTWVDLAQVRARQLEAPRNVWQLAELALAAGATPLSIARRWLGAFNGRDLDGLLALYAEGAVHESPKKRAADPASDGKIVGKDALRAWWNDAFARLPELRYEERSLTADGQRVWMEYLRILPGQPAMPVSEVLEVRAGRIHASRVFHG